MSKRILFGTDGIRGESNQYPVTPEACLRLGRSLAHLINIGKIGRNKPGHRHRIVIGKDTRLSGYMLEQALSAGICSMGVDVMMVGPLPTAGIAFIAKSMRADSGIVISASHNPYNDNGIKIFDHNGYKLSDEIEYELEQLTLKSSIDHIRADHHQIGKTSRIDDALGRYVVFIKNALPQNKTLDGFKIVVDCAHGSGYKVAPLVLSELGADVITLGDKPNGININHEVGCLAPQKAIELVKKYQAHLGIVLDGDADRLKLIDENGHLINGDALIAILAKYLKSQKKLAKDTVVATIMSNIGLEQYLHKNNINVVRTDVGDRYVIAKMLKDGYSFGGENSGHLIHQNHTTTGDGILAAILTLSIMIEKKQPLSKLTKDFNLAHQELININISKKPPLSELNKIQDLITQVKNDLQGIGRVLVRYSGTEMKARVLVESHDEKINKQKAQQIAQMLHEELS